MTEPIVIRSTDGVITLTYDMSATSSRGPGDVAGAGPAPLFGSGAGSFAEPCRLNDPASTQRTTCACSSEIP